MHLICTLTRVKQQERDVHVLQAVGRQHLFFLFFSLFEQNHPQCAALRCVAAEILRNTTQKACIFISASILGGKMKRAKLTLKR